MVNNLVCSTAVHKRGCISRITYGDGEKKPKLSSLQAVPQINKSETWSVGHRIFKTPQEIPTLNQS